jgi:ribosome-binding factor A
MTPEPGTRAKRVGESVRQEVATLLATEVKDPRVAGAVVTRVEMTGDLRSARVHVCLLEAGDSVVRRRALIGALGRASGLIRREITRRLGLRFAPELRFLYDDGADALTEVERLLAEITAERQSRKP